MGYRSEVYIKIHTKYEPEFRFLLSLHKINYIHREEDEGDEYIRYMGQDLKWYTGYKDVDLINSFMETRDKCALIAIGEDSQLSAEFGDLDGTDMEVCTETYINGF